MPKRNGPRTRIKAAISRAEGNTRDHSGGMHARGMSREGYAGGYAAALSDVLLVLDGFKPSDTWGFWKDWTDTEDSR